LGESKSVRKGGDAYKKAEKKKREKVINFPTVGSWQERKKGVWGESRGKNSMKNKLPPEQRRDKQVKERIQEKKKIHPALGTQEPPPRKEKATRKKEGLGVVRRV